MVQRRELCLWARLRREIDLLFKRPGSLQGAGVEAGWKKTLRASPCFPRQAITPRWPYHLNGCGLRALPATLPVVRARDCHSGRWDSRYTNADDSTRSTSESSQGCPLCFAVCERWPLRPVWRDGNTSRGCTRLYQFPAPPKLHGIPAKCICSAWLPPRSPSPECYKKNQIQHTPA